MSAVWSRPVGLRLPGRHSIVTRMASRRSVLAAPRIGAGCVVHLIRSSSTPTRSPSPARAEAGAAQAQTRESKAAAEALTYRIVGGARAATTARK
jgi:hypothetical protein